MQPGTPQAPLDTAESERKRTVRVGLETATHSILGTLTLAPHGYRARFSDHLNRSDIDYVSLTDAEKTPLGGGPTESHPFLAVARKAVVFGYSLEHDAV